MIRNGEDVTDAPTAVHVDATEVEVELLTAMDVTAGREKIKVGAGQSVKHFWQLCTVPLNDDKRFWPVRSY